MYEIYVLLFAMIIDSYIGLCLIWIEGTNIIGSGFSVIVWIQK